MIRTENYRRELLFIFFAQKKIIILITLIILILSILIALFWPPTFASYGSILVRGKKLEQTPESIERTEIRSIAVSKEDLYSEVEILTSFGVIEQAIKYLVENNLYKIKEVNNETSFLTDIKMKITSLFSTESNSDAKRSPLQREVYRIRSKLKTQVIPASNVINITFYNHDPKVAVTILDAVMNQYILYRMGVFSPTEAESFFAQQADKFKNDLEKREDELMGLIEKTKITNPQMEIENNIIIKKELENQLNILVNDYIENVSYVEHIEQVLNKPGIKYFSFIDNIPISALSGKLQDLVVEKGILLRTYRDDSEKIKPIDRQINNVYSALKSEVILYNSNIKAKIDIINDKIKSIKSRLDAINDRNVNLEKQLLKSNRIARETDLLKYSFNSFAKRREESKADRTVASANLSSYVRIMSEPFPSNGRVFPKAMIVIPLGLIIGFITGCSLGFLNDYFDHTFKKPSDVYNYAGLPVIFSMPKWNDTKKVKSLCIIGFIIPLFGAYIVSTVSPDLSSIIDPGKQYSSQKVYNAPTTNTETTITPQIKNSTITGIQDKESPVTVAKFIDIENTDPIKTFKNEEENDIGKKAVVGEKEAKIIPDDQTKNLFSSAVKKSIPIYDNHKKAWFLQVHSFKNKKRAEIESTKLKNYGWQSTIMNANIKGYGHTCRVLIGPFSRKEEALKARQEGEPTKNVF